MADTLCPSCKTPLPPDASFCMHCGVQTPTRVTGAASGPRSGALADVPVQERLARSLGPKYEVRRLLGHGGFAEVYEVWDVDLQRRLAVKVLKPDIAWSSGMLERFKQEARAIARLSHPNILAIHFVGDGEGLVYYAMPFIEGQSLGELLRKSGALDPERAVDIARPILDALSHAHQQGLVHRDIKPDNVMLEAGSGRVLLVDFGIAKQLGSGTQMTQTGFVVGTPQYMSPEQALGQGDLDARTDIYAMGAKLFQMVTGAPPFDGDSSQEIVGKHLSEPVPVPNNLNTKIPKWLSDVIVRCLAKRAGDRFQSSAMVLAALEEGRKSGARQVISAERVARRIQSDDTTELMPSAERPAAKPIVAAPLAGPASGAPGPADSPPARSGSWGRWMLLLLGMAAVALLVRALFAAPVLIVENRLVDPIRVAVGARAIEIAPGARARIPLARRQPLVAQWSLVRPTDAEGRALGSELQGTIADEHPRRRMLEVVDSRSAGAPFFAPLLTNASDRPLGVRINAGLIGATDCGCSVPPGSNRMHIGYYPLFANSSVEAYAADSSRAVFRDLGPRVDRLPGVVGLRFATKDLRR